MCMGGSPSIPVAEEPTPPPPPPPPPVPTAQGLTVGDKRINSPIKNFLSKALGAKRSKASLQIPLGGIDASGESGLNIPG